MKKTFYSELARHTKALWYVFDTEILAKRALWLDIGSEERKWCKNYLGGGEKIYICHSFRYCNVILFVLKRMF